MAHIPSGTTAELELLTFRQALEAANTPCEEYDIKKWLYAPNFYSEYRYLLGTRGSHPLICVGINPSTARPDALDNTLKSVQRIALGNGFDSFVMFNVYAQRATRPEDMDRELNLQLHQANMAAFEYILRNVAQGLRPAVWAAWGTIIEKRSYLPGCVRDMVALGRRYNARWLCAGKRSAKGHPTTPCICARTKKLWILILRNIWRDYNDQACSVPIANRAGTGGDYGQGLPHGERGRPERRENRGPAGDVQLSL